MTKESKRLEAYHHLKDGTRWEKFSHNDLQMLRYGLAQIYDTTKDDINNMLKELNAILSPKDFDYGIE